MGLSFSFNTREVMAVGKIRAFPKEAKKEPRRRSSIPSPEKIGMTSKHLPFSR